MSCPIGLQHPRRGLLRSSVEVRGVGYRWEIRCNYRGGEDVEGKRDGEGTAGPRAGVTSDEKFGSPPERSQTVGLLYRTRAYVRDFRIRERREIAKLSESVQRRKKSWRARIDVQGSNWICLSGILFNTKSNELL